MDCREHQTWTKCPNRRAHHQYRRMNQRHTEEWMSELQVTVICLVATHRIRSNAGTILKLNELEIRNIRWEKVKLTPFPIFGCFVLRPREREKTQESRHESAGGGSSLYQRDPGTISCIKNWDMWRSRLKEVGSSHATTVTPPTDQNLNKVDHV